jgi:phosphatidylethanolamine-binding protein (PEBP) family uncharacterized protein
MEVIYNNKPIINNEFLKVSKTQNKPEIKLNINNNKSYLLIMYDPDAVVGTRVHWILSDIKNNDANLGKVIIPYKGPAPPPKTGNHRYIFELYNQEIPIIDEVKERNISIESLRKKLNLTEPINTVKFISKNENGGKRRRTRKRKNIKARANKISRKYH